MRERIADWLVEHPWALKIASHLGCSCAKHRMRRASFGTGMWLGATGACLVLDLWVAACFAFILAGHHVSRGIAAAKQQRSEDELRARIEDVIQYIGARPDEPRHEQRPM